MSGRRKARRRAEKRALLRRRRRRIAVLIAAVVAISIAVAAAFFIIPGSGEESAPSAAIVDQLSLTFPNPDFVEAATETLEEAGYGVDYYPGEEVTVEFYRELPEHDYDLIVLRVHSARLLEVDLSAATDDAILFTAEAYSEAVYREEQEAERLAKTYYSERGGQAYFGIMSDFVNYSMKGTFDDSTVILMGCDGLRSPVTAEAFLERGARSFVSWDGPVSADHTDAATERLLRHLLVDGLGIREAVAETVAEVGEDPAYGSTLLVHTSEG